MGDTKGAERYEEMHRQFNSRYEIFRARQKELLAHPDRAEAHYNVGVAQEAFPRNYLYPKWLARSGG